MDFALLCDAVREDTWYLDRFTRRDYPDAFRVYGERFGPFFAEMLQEIAGNEAALAALSDTLLDALEQEWKRRRFWSRTAVRVNEKQMLVSYFSPLLLDLEALGGRAFAECLRDRWNCRWPKDAYHIAEFAEIQSGFRDTLMGLEMLIPGRKKETDREEPL